MERVKECMEELLSFTLNSHINQTLGSDLGLCSQFCSDLLREENDAVSVAADVDLDQDVLQGVPLYPLYKRLALALVRSVSCRAFCRTYNDGVVLVREDGLLKEREEAWSELVLNKGDELVNILKMVDSELDVQEPFFSMIKDGLKTVEGRCAIGDYDRLEPGLMILLNKCMILEVESVRHYASFSELLEAESLMKVLPGVKTVEEGVQIYRNLYVEEKERLNGVLAICVSKLATQPYITLATILSGVGYEGVQSLLGLAHTPGTISDALPPPRSTLLSSFLLPFKPNVKGSTLTQGARALAKHVNRSNNRYWGIFNGSDSDKNRFAMDVIYRLIANCCWLNVHIVQPHGIVFEIRVADGYGARWSKDGTKDFLSHTLKMVTPRDGSIRLTLDGFVVISFIDVRLLRHMRNGLISCDCLGREAQVTLFTSNYGYNNFNDVLPLPLVPLSLVHSQLSPPMWEDDNGV